MNQETGSLYSKMFALLFDVKYIRRHRKTRNVTVSDTKLFLVHEQTAGVILRLRWLSKLL